jgi:heat shock protein HslJ
MKKSTYVFLLIITIPLIAYTLYYSSTHPSSPTQTLLSLQASTTEVIPSATTTESSLKKILTTHSGKTITITESNPISQSLSSLVITPSGFSTNTPILLETNKISNFFLFDLNNDSFDELILVSQSQGSGSYGEVQIYTTTNDTELSPVPVPKVSEADTKKGGLFEGYMGHDTFTVASDTLLREFPTYTATDTNSLPTGPHTTLVYRMTINNAIPTITISKANASVFSSTGAQLIATTTPLSKTSWVWTSSTIGTTTVKAPQGIPFTLDFDATKTVHGIADCNTLSGTYVTNSKEIQFTSLVSSNHPCENGTNEVYVELLTKVRSYALAGNSVTFALSNNGSLLFTKKK